MIERIIIHAGTPKTGTTSLQKTLNENREDLIRHGMLYPAFGLPEPSVVPDPWFEPKHQWLVQDLSSSDGAALGEHVRGASAEAATRCNTMLLSAEGVFNHWWTFPPGSKQVLAEIAKHFKIELWVWFRNPVDLFTSYYIQILKNPRNGPLGYGLDWSPEGVLDSGIFRRLFDYAEFLDDVVTTLGPGAVVRAFAYRGTTVSDAYAALGLAPPCGELRSNKALGVIGVEMTRLLNRHCIDSDRKMKAVDLIHQLDAVLGDASKPFTLEPEVEARVQAMAAKSLNRLHREYGLDLVAAPSKPKGETRDRTA